MKKRIKYQFMNKYFIELTQKMVKERGKNVLNDKKIAKALLLDYSHGEYKNEINLLVKTIELGFPKRIKETNDVDIIRLILSRQLVEENFIMEKIAVSTVSLLINLIMDDRCSNEIKEEKIKKIDKEIVENKQPLKEKSMAVHTIEEDIIKRSSEIWICGRCKTSNDFELDYCRKCGKIFNPPLTKSSGKTITIRPALWQIKKK
jgi:ribosomal protein L40E